jgi:hypothetical protein
VPARLGGRRIGLSSRFAGVPVVAHVLDGRAPLVLSADLDDASLSTVSRAQMEAATRALPVHPPETLRGEGIRENVIWTAASVAIIALAIVGILTDATPDVVDVSWIVGGLACFSLLLALIVWPGARRQAARRYEIVDDADGVTVTVHRPNHPPVVIRSTAVTRLAHHPGGSRRGMWYVSAGGVHVGIAARTGERVVGAIRRRRPDLGISTTRVGR